MSVAVAASASAPVRELAAEFTAETGVEVAITTAATGVLYAQAMRGAPFDVLVAADTLRASALEAAGRLAPAGRRRWGRGRLVLFVPAGLGPDVGVEVGSEAGPPQLSGDSLTLLRRALQTLMDEGALLARANPRTAPYGAAAEATLAALGLDLGPGPVGESVGQTWQYVVSGAAEAGFVARAQVRERPSSQWLAVPESLHHPLLHDVVLLEAGADSSAARRFFDYLTSPGAERTWRRHGYEPAPALSTGRPR